MICFKKKYNISLRELFLIAQVDWQPSDKPVVWCIVKGHCFGQIKWNYYISNHIKK